MQYLFDNVLPKLVSLLAKALRNYAFDAATDLIEIGHQEFWADYKGNRVIGSSGEVRSGARQSALGVRPLGILINHTQTAKADSPTADSLGFPEIPDRQDKLNSRILRSSI